MEELPSPLLIAGSGAMACLFAARLSAAGVPVAILANWKAGLEAIRRNGVHLVEADGSERAFRVPVIDAQASGERLDIQSRYALVLVKSWQTGRTARQLAGRLAEDGLALTLQNGLGNREALAEILGEQRVALGVTTAGATLLAPGRVRPAGKGLVTLSVGPHLEPLANLLRSAGFEVENAPDSIALLWGKLVINAAINPLTALLGVPNGELLERQTARLLLAAVACEAAAVAAAQGILLPYPDPVQAAERVARGTAANHSSMLQDVRRGTPTEVDAICGAIVAAGQRAGVPTPVNRTLWQLVKALEIRDRQRTHNLRSPTTHPYIRIIKMNTVTALDELFAARDRLAEPVGLVPTMGYLHEGHLSLVRAAREECASVIASIFVNPTQFGPNEDLSAYPRDLPRDLDLLAGEGVDLVWTPSPEIMYPPGFQTWVMAEEITRPLEGSMRPGHFRGVTTVVAKLFNAVRPNKAYFGQKDAQQAAVIRQMVRDLSYPLEIVVCPILREPDGLAMSSRNVYLNPAERRAATVLYRALSAAKEAFAGGERHPQELRRILAETINREPLARLQYISCADPDTLQELETPIHGRALLSMAVFVGKTRLIDNIVIRDA